MKQAESNKQNMPEITVGTILEHSIGCGCDEYWQVVSRTPKTVTARRIDYEIVKRYPKFQSMDIAPVKNAFRPPEIQSHHMGQKDGKSVFKDVDINIVKLKLSDDGKIGPSVRMIWWSVYNGKAKNQYSS